jgi:hypothetical protein
MEGVDEKAKEWARDEHHPYNFSYLFKDSAVNNIFSTDEKKALAQQAQHCVIVPLYSFRVPGLDD